MTPQQIFDRVGVHLLTQNQVSAIHYPSKIRCVYRGPNGLKCAIGVLIPDENYTQSLDSDEVTFKTVLATLGFRITTEITELLCDLQDVHDRHSPSQWYDCLCNIATRLGLSSQSIEPYRI